MASPVLEFNYDISCPFAYIASTRVEALTQRTSATLIWRPVLLGAIYRATSAPQGAAGSASDVFNPTKKAITARSLQRTLARYKLAYNPPSRHPVKTVNALRLIYHVPAAERPALSKALFRSYWVEGRDVSDTTTLLAVVGESGITSAKSLNTIEGIEFAFSDSSARQSLERATADAVDRGAVGVPSFWLPNWNWTDSVSKQHRGRLFWGQDRMHFVEISLLALSKDIVDVPLCSLMPRCVDKNRPHGKVRLEFWYDFSSPWAFLGWTQLARLQRRSGDNLEIDMKPFLLGALFREIGAPNLPMNALSPQKSRYMQQDHADWVQFWNAINAQEGDPNKPIEFHWADVFPIRTPTLLRCAVVDPTTVPLLYRACWESNANVADESILAKILSESGYNGPELINKASAPAIKQRLRDLTAEAKVAGICGVPSYRVFRKTDYGTEVAVGDIVWGQDEINVVEDLIAGWHDESLPSDRRTGEFKSQPRL